MKISQPPLAVGLKHLQLRLWVLRGHLLDEVGIGTTYDGIQQLNVLDWLMAEP